MKRRDESAKVADWKPVDWKRWPAWRVDYVEALMQVASVETGQLYQPRGYPDPQLVGRILLERGYL